MDKMEKLAKRISSLIVNLIIGIVSSLAIYYANGTNAEVLMTFLILFSNGMLIDQLQDKNFN